MKKTTKTIIVFNEVNNFCNEIANGIYTGVNRQAWFNEIGADNTVCYIPLIVSGSSYQERKNDIQNKAIEWSYAGGAANWSYSELSEIQSFFEVNGKRYGLIKEFTENGII